MMLENQTVIHELETQLNRLDSEYDHPLWTPAQVARLLKVNVRSLANDRYLRKGLPFIRLHGKIYYDRAAVLGALANSRIQTDL